MPESGATFADNALIKAREGHRRTGLPTVADDSGLAVDALNGMPGRAVRALGRTVMTTRRICGWCWRRSPTCPTSGCPPRSCVRWPMYGDAGEIVTHGQMPGHLVREPRGTNGFGYDPIFVADGHTQTSGELAVAEKDAISHRGQALRALATRLAEETT